MPRNRHKPVFRETSELVAVQPEQGSYSFVNPKRAKRTAAVVVPPPDIEESDEDTRMTGEFTAAVMRLVHGSLAPKREAYHDPNLCNCPGMQKALKTKLVMVVMAGPVTLAPAVLREEMILSGNVSLDSIGAYDGKPWAFRHCPFEGCLIDEQVEVLPPTDVMSCCGTMALAVTHERVVLSGPESLNRAIAKFTEAGRTSIFFTRCPWCASEMVDLAIARYKRHLGL